ncbi:hypothetical protein [Arthrobacter sp. ERGS1:01]|uniref:hypothetical protein n=1 Tax=Arthrobacter sp. ERGS1:01 TaxID=1704044 RepID=UPI000A4A9F4A|nr:hypothetical protein [Arthrobacter sp. ERGS1:01]
MNLDVLAEPVSEKTTKAPPTSPWAAGTVFPAERREHADPERSLLHLRSAQYRLQK